MSAGQAPSLGKGKSAIRDDVWVWMMDTGTCEFPLDRPHKLTITISDTKEWSF